jgi:hypothetical protein
MQCDQYRYFILILRESNTDIISMHFPFPHESPRHSKIIAYASQPFFPVAVVQQTVKTYGAASCAFLTRFVSISLKGNIHQK